MSIEIEIIFNVSGLGFVRKLHRWPESQVFCLARLAKRAILNSIAMTSHLTGPLFLGRAKGMVMRRACSY